MLSQRPPSLRNTTAISHLSSLRCEIDITAWTDGWRAGAGIHIKCSKCVTATWWWWFYPTHSWGWGRGSILQNPNNRATPHGRDQRSRSDRVWPNMARRRGSSTGQSSTRCERSCGSEPQLLHEGARLDQPCGDKS